MNASEAKALRSRAVRTRQAEERLTTERAARDVLIVAAYADNTRIDAIVEATGLSYEGVRKIIRAGRT